MAKDKERLKRLGEHAPPAIPKGHAAVIVRVTGPAPLMERFKALTARERGELVSRALRDREE